MTERKVGRRAACRLAAQGHRSRAMNRSRSLTAKPLQMGISWRRRESNPRPRPHRPSVYERSPRFAFARRSVRGQPADGLAILSGRASGDWLSLGAEPDRWRPCPGLGPNREGRRYLVSTRRRVRDRSSHLRCCRWIYEANRRPRLATLPENRPRRNLVAPVCLPHRSQHLRRIRIGPCSRTRNARHSTSHEEETGGERRDRPVRVRGVRRGSAGS